MSSTALPSTTADSASRKRKRETAIDEHDAKLSNNGATESDDYGEDANPLLVEEDKGLYDAESENEAEGDEPQTEEVEPSEENFGKKIKFYKVCEALEKISTRSSSKPIPLEKKLMNLLPARGIKMLKQTKPGAPPETPFPFIRLLCPEKDASREYFVKHNTLAKAYIKAHAWDNKNPIAQALLKPEDPQRIAAANLPPVMGDLSELIRIVLTGRIDKKPSSLTVADINKALDELAAFKHRGNVRPSNHDWEAGSGNASKRKKNDETQKLGELQADWIKRFLSGSRRLSPLEHKWLTRIVLKEMKINLGFDKILRWFDPIAPALWSGHNSLRGLCRVISQPGFQGKLAIMDDKDSGDSVHFVAPYLTRSTAKIQVGVIFTPMFSHRTGFDRMLYDLSLKHRTFLDDPVFGRLEEEANLKMASCMVLEHPAMAIETKLDGERMIVHLSRDGIVKMHTRNANWYSDMYSPCLGPSLREAFGHLNMDMILDGEVLAWDDEKKETIPFGNNRTVAAFRTEYMKYHGTLDTRDRDLHLGEKDVKVMHMNKAWQDGEGQVPDLNGRDCWLQFIAFDIVFLDGDGAQELLDKVGPTYMKTTPGPLMDLECIERKKILYHVIRRVPRFVEVVPTLVVSCDGATYKGERYFSLERPPTFRGRPLHSLESVATYLKEISDAAKVRKRQDLEQERRQGRENEVISKARALAVGGHYRRIVEDQRQEGLIFKDLSTPYVLDKVSRSLGYWRKFKPDYYNGSVASDIDLVIVGAYFASGLRNSGRPNSFLCACIDESEPEDRYVPLCKVNAGSISFAWMKKILGHTKYQEATGMTALDTGKWFSYGESRREFPEFITSKSFTDDSGTPSLEGWKPKKEDYPDLWINPEDSVILTINAGEICPSTAFPSGVTLRFPRITQVRFDDKRPREVVPLHDLWDKYAELLADRAGDNSERAFESGTVPSTDKEKLTERFWTEEKFSSEGRGQRKKKPKNLHSISNIHESVSTESSAFQNAVFVPLEGTYRLAEKSLEADEAQEEGWLDEARAIKDYSSVRALIKKHGGTVLLSPDAKLLENGALIIGGDKSDPRVVNFVEMIEKARIQVPELKMKKKPSSADQDALLFAKCSGVVRWTFLLSVLAKWRSSQGENASNAKIREKDPDLLTPDPLDFLARPKCPGGGIARELCLMDVQNPTKMRRLLHEVANDTAGIDETDPIRSDELTWQDLCKKSLDPCDRWIMRGSNQTLWPYEEDRVVIQETAVYVDVFADPRASSNDLSKVDPSEHAAVLSVLPLLRISGAFIETKLGGRCTHVLCSLGDGICTISFEEATPEHFVDIERGKIILEAIQKSPLYPESCPDLASPLWAREEVWKHPDRSD